jgi:hypothetical protein
MEVVVDRADGRAAGGCRVLGTASDGGSAGSPARAGAEGWIDDDGAVRAHVEWRDA